MPKPTLPPAGSLQGLPQKAPLLSPQAISFASGETDNTGWQDLLPLRLFWLFNVSPEWGFSNIHPFCSANLVRKG